MKLPTDVRQIVDAVDAGGTLPKLDEVRRYNLAEAATRNNGVYIWPGLKLNLEINLARHRVARCAVCNLRRVLYSLAIVGMGESPRMCAPCAGIRP